MKLYIKWAESLRMTLTSLDDTDHKKTKQKQQQKPQNSDEYY